MPRLPILLLLSLSLSAQEPVDLAVVHRIKAEAFQNSTIMESAFHLSDVYGARLTATPSIRAAAEWCLRRMKEFGLDNPHLETWGPYGRRWVNTYFSAHLHEPQYAPIIGVPRAYARGTNGPVTGQPLLAPIHSIDDFPKFKGKLRGRIVMTENPPNLRPQSTPLMKRFSSAELAQMEAAPEPGAPSGPYDPSARYKFRDQLSAFFNDEGVALVLSPSFRPGRQDPGLLVEGGTIFASYAGSWKLDAPVSPPAAAIAAEHYNRIARLLQHNIPVSVEVDIRNEISDEPRNSFSVLGEIRGTTKPAEIVMIGAHLDGVPFATAATDNAAGVAVVLEAMRILKKLDLKMPRTVRVGLWTGEEQQQGSLPYVTRHRAELQAGLSAYFNYDDGTGKIRGVHLQNNDSMRPIFQSWFAPFRDLGVSTISIASVYGSDFVPFDNAGLPAFAFIQDPIEYDTRTHHSSMDYYDRLQAPDLMQSAAVIASIAYHATTRGQLLPRKPHQPHN